MAPGESGGVVLDAAQTAALEHPFGTVGLAICGSAGTGKTTVLLQRAARAVRLHGGRDVILSAPSDGGVARLRALHAAHGLPVAATCATFGELAFEVLRALGTPGAESPQALDDARAAQLFERAGAKIFALEWTDFVTADIDPEITGLRAPERFSAAAFRLIRKLRGSLVSPEDFRAAGLRGAISFYGRPPNFANTELLAATPPKYHDSLRVSPAELERQRTREVDLVHILTQLYESYVATLTANGCLTAVDAVYEAVLLLRAKPGSARTLRERYTDAFVDDAQDLSTAQIGLFEALFGRELRDVTLCGDETQSTRAFAGGGRGGDLLRRTPARIACTTNYGCSAAIEAAARAVLGAPVAGAERSATHDAGDAIDAYRGDTVRDEARNVASEIGRLIAAGTAPGAIAVVTRSLSCAHVYIDALLARNVPLDVAGAASLYAFPATLDALGVLWSAVDPFRHDYLLRNLEAPWLRLSDASIALLCAETPSAQALLFEVPGDDAEDAGAERWDRRRALRLGRNVTRGDVDAELPPEARERLLAFRAARARWEAAARRLSPGELARDIFAESVRAIPPQNARERFEHGLVERLCDEIDRFAAADPLATLEDFLAFAETSAAGETDALALSLALENAVRVLDVEAAKGTFFDYVFVVDVRAGAWPRYYVPDAFLFMPATGMIPKENVGDARTARTAKFTYALFKYKLREKYNAEERRALYCAATRARLRLYVSAAGRATKGTGTPELLEELRDRAERRGAHFIRS